MWFVCAFIWHKGAECKHRILNMAMKVQRPSYSSILELDAKLWVTGRFERWKLKVVARPLNAIYRSLFDLEPHTHRCRHSIQRWKTYSRPLPSLREHLWPWLFRYFCKIVLRLQLIAIANEPRVQYFWDIHQSAQTLLREGLVQPQWRGHTYVMCNFFLDHDRALCSKSLKYYSSTWMTKRGRL